MVFKIKIKNLPYWHDTLFLQSIGSSNTPGAVHTLFAKITIKKIKHFPKIQINRKFEYSRVKQVAPE